MIRILIADDNAVVRHGLHAILSMADDLEVVAQAENGVDAVELARRTSPDVVLLDVNMPGGDGITAAADLADDHRVLMVTYSEDDETVQAALRAGARGYLVYGQQDPAEIVAAVRRVASGGVVLGPAAAAVAVQAMQAVPAVVDAGEELGLTRRQTEVLGLASQGMSNGEIAAELVLSRKTVKNHMHAIYQGLGVSSRAEAIAAWLRLPGRR